VCKDLFAVNGFWSEHGSHDVRMGKEKDLAKRCLKHKIALYQIHASGRTEVEEKNLMDLPAERRWLQHAAKNPKLFPKAKTPQAQMFDILPARTVDRIIESMATDVVSKENIVTRKMEQRRTERKRKTDQSQSPTKREHQMRRNVSKYEKYSDRKDAAKKYIVRDVSPQKFLSKQPTAAQRHATLTLQHSLEATETGNGFAASDGTIMLCGVEAPTDIFSLDLGVVAPSCTKNAAESEENFAMKHLENTMRHIPGGNVTFQPAILTDGVTGASSSNIGFAMV
jgi:uncharacterized protein (DUF2384 family)